MTDQQLKGCLFNIERFAVHDGPGIRVLIFFKGCPLRCIWCCNPESQNSSPEIMISHERCIKSNECELCLGTCLQGAISFSQSRIISLDRKQCNHCGDCAEVCPAKAIQIIGKHYSVSDVFEIVHQEMSFFCRSGGGITLSGGEPLLQPAFALELLRKANSEGLDTAIETCGHVPWESLYLALQELNTIFYDLKIMDSDLHLQYVGFDNQLILNNLRKLSEACDTPKIIARTPIIPGFNDSEENIQSTAEFVAGLNGVFRYELLPYHRLGEGKYQSLGFTSQMEGVEKPTVEKMSRLQALIDNSC